MLRTRRLLTEAVCSLRPLLTAAAALTNPLLEPPRVERERNPDQPHYLGYAFIAAPHLEGVVPGKRQPLFANGGAGIAVSRGALAAALPIFQQCEETYKWNWPGDVRVAQW